MKMYDKLHTTAIGYCQNLEVRAVDLFHTTITMFKTLVLQAMPTTLSNLYIMLSAPATVTQC